MRHLLDRTGVIPVVRYRPTSLCQAPCASLAEGPVGIQAIDRHLDSDVFGAWWFRNGLACAVRTHANVGSGNAQANYKPTDVIRPSL